LKKYHVTVLSNFARGYDKYQGTYSKSAIPESTFPDRFFLLDKENLNPGIAKAERLMARLALEGDALILLEVSVAEGSLRGDHASGVGHYIEQNFVRLDSVSYVERDEGGLLIMQARVEDVLARSLRLEGAGLLSWKELRPRTVSVLPIGVACQASCAFCFSKASVSADYRGRISDWCTVSKGILAAKAAGAERAVITGGGEPTLLKEPEMLRLIAECGTAYDKVVLITNAHLLARLTEERRLAAIDAYHDAGLTVLAISRHHNEHAKNAQIMGLDVASDIVARSVADNPDRYRRLQPRFICVLQKGGVETIEDMETYLRWSASLGVTQVNFKELYVSTRVESDYSDRAANDYSARMQVPLRVVHDFVAKHGWIKQGELPWGAPIFAGSIAGQDMQIAAYTEPSVHWERSHGVARSWNIMSDGKTLASLEDTDSVVSIDEFL
jgi:organic radical activating enzyme